MQTLWWWFCNTRLCSTLVDNVHRQIIYPVLHRKKVFWDTCVRPMSILIRYCCNLNILRIGPASVVMCSLFVNFSHFSSCLPLPSLAFPLSLLAFPLPLPSLTYILPFSFLFFFFFFNFSLVSFELPYVDNTLFPTCSNQLFRWSGSSF